MGKVFGLGRDMVWWVIWEVDRFDDLVLDEVGLCVAVGWT